MAPTLVAVEHRCPSLVEDSVNLAPTLVAVKHRCPKGTMSTHENFKHKILFLTGRRGSVHHDDLPTRAADARVQVLRRQVPEQGVPRRLRHQGGGVRLRRGRHDAGITTPGNCSFRWKYKKFSVAFIPIFSRTCRNFLLKSFSRGVSKVYLPRISKFVSSCFRRLICRLVINVWLDFAQIRFSDWPSDFKFLNAKFSSRSVQDV